MAQNLTQDETRKLERQRLAESMLYYPAEGDAQQVEARTAPAAPDGIDNLADQIDALPNLGNEEKALAKAFGIAAVAGRNRGKIMNLAERPDPLAETTIAWWRLDFTGNTWQNSAHICISQVVQNLNHLRSRTPNVQSKTPIDS